MARRLLLLVAATIAILAVVPPASAPPPQGVFVAGESLAGVRLRMTRAEVLRTWGTRHGVCHDCPRTTWYFNRRPFAPEGAGVVFERGRVVHAFTVWRPRGWRSLDGLILGADASELDSSLREWPCAGYEARLAGSRRAESVFYVYRDKLWGFGLIRPRANPCL
jgi:hypothetical protein